MKLIPEWYNHDIEIYRVHFPDRRFVIAARVQRESG